MKKFHSNTAPATIGKVYKYFQEGFEKQATVNPKNTALITADCTFTYKELEENANRIANSLFERGVKPKSKVALFRAT